MGGGCIITLFGLVRAVFIMTRNHTYNSLLHAQNLEAKPQKGFFYGYLNFASKGSRCIKKESSSNLKIKISYIKENKYSFLLIFNSKKSLNTVLGPLMILNNTNKR